MPRVFVGIPTWNRPLWVPEAVESVLAQTFQDFRIVVSDNASEPKHAEAVAKYVRDLGDARVSYHLQSVNEGEYGQGRFFMQACGEEYFTMFHDDDRMEPSYLERAVGALDADRDLVAFMANSFAFDEKGKPYPEMTRRLRRHQHRDAQPEGPMEMLGPLMSCGFLPISGTVFPTRVLRASRFAADGTGCYPFEFDVLLRVCENGGRVYYCRDELIGFRFHTSSMRNYLNMWANPQVVGDLIRHLETRRFRGKNERIRRWLLATMYAFRSKISATEGRGSAARKEALKALRLHPLCRYIWTTAAPGLVLPAGLRGGGRARAAGAGPR
jgi:glycosyltransferase involved in cell wall biosynthesis